MWFTPLHPARVQLLPVAVPGRESGRGSTGLAGAEGRRGTCREEGGEEEGGGGNEKTHHPVSFEATALCIIM